MYDEIKGEGNSINYTFRMHDPRIGRFFAIDPLSPRYPHNSPYAFSENRVIDCVELEGREFDIKKTEKGWHISVAFKIVNNMEDFVISQDYLNKIIFQVTTDIKQFNGFDTDSDYISFSATYDPKATINVYIVDSFQKTAVKKGPKIFNTVESKADASGAAITPQSQKGNSITGSVFIKSENTSLQSESTSVTRVNGDKVEKLNAAFTIFHEFFVHLISQTIKGTEDHKPPAVGDDSNRMIDKKGSTVLSVRRKIDVNNQVNNLFQSSSNKVDFLLNAAQLKSIKENIMAGKENYESKEAVKLTPSKDEIVIPNQ